MFQDLVYPYGEPVATGILKSEPSDFIVDEELGFEPSGDGEHLFLKIEKVGLSTHELIARIARDCGLHPKHIGYSGLKDKHALTRQWLSLHLPGKAAEIELHDSDDYRLLRQVRHDRKLRPGTHRSNFFTLRLRGVDAFTEQTRTQLQSTGERGFANYFGAQRFGRKQDNVEQALRQLQGKRIPRSRKGILLSSLRSFLFNQILAQRIALGYWDLPLDGDVFMLRGSHSIFTEFPDHELIERYRQLDIASTASLYGEGCNRLRGEPLLLETGVFEAHQQITQCLDQQGSKLQMRTLRAIVEDLKHEYDSAQKCLSLSLRLSAGCYVTSLLAHFIELRDASN